MNNTGMKLPEPGCILNFRPMDRSNDIFSDFRDACEGLKDKRGNSI